MDGDSYFIKELNQYLPRVTNILKIISKGEAYEGWLMKQGEQATKERDEAGDIGSSLHNRLEELGKGITINLEALKERERMWVEEFLGWRDKNIAKFIATEMTVYHPEFLYAGTLDGLVELKDGRIALLDYKTSKYIYDTYHLQVSSYIRAWEKLNHRDIDTGIILRFDKTKKKDTLEAKEVTALDYQFRMFLNALELYNWKNKMKGEFKSETKTV